jgi:hypothetical protein
MPGGNRKFRFFVICVRGNPQYGKNDFHDNGDGTVTDLATGLTWTKADSLKPMNWQQSLAWVETMNAAKHLGHDDWRMPDIKELQSIVDYTRSPDTSDSPAIDPILSCSTITNESGKPDYPCYWSGTTHVGLEKGAAAMYIAFGRAGGFLSERPLPGGPRPGGPREAADAGPVKFADVHGAGAQRSDPKSGDPREFPRGRGPQGDVIRIFNHVRLVRGGGVVPHAADIPSKQSATPPESPRSGIPPAPFTPPLVATLDANHNDIIEAGEISNAPETLKTLDKNGDGNLSPEEYRPRMQGGQDGPGGGRMPGRPGR